MTIAFIGLIVWLALTYICLRVFTFEKMFPYTSSLLKTSSFLSQTSQTFEINGTSTTIITTKFIN